MTPARAGTTAWVVTVRVLIGDDPRSRGDDRSRATMFDVLRG